MDTLNNEVEKKKNNERIKKIKRSNEYYHKLREGYNLYYKMIKSQ